MTQVKFNGSASEWTPSQPASADSPATRGLYIVPDAGRAFPSRGKFPGRECCAQWVCLQGKPPGLPCFAGQLAHRRMREAFPSRGNPSLCARPLRALVARDKSARDTSSFPRKRESKRGIKQGQCAGMTALRFNSPHTPTDFAKAGQHAPTEKYTRRRARFKLQGMTARESAQQ